MRHSGASSTVARGLITRTIKGISLSPDNSLANPIRWSLDGFSSTIWLVVPMVMMTLIVVMMVTRSFTLASALAIVVIRRPGSMQILMSSMPPVLGVTVRPVMCMCMCVPMSMLMAVTTLAMMVTPRGMGRLRRRWHRTCRIATHMGSMEDRRRTRSGIGYLWDWHGHGRRRDWWGPLRQCAVVD
jgi:hypothetical protein